MEIRKSKISYFFLIFAAIVFTFFLIAVRSGEPLSFDSGISSFLTGLFSDATYPFFKLFDGLGSRLGVGIVCLVIIAWLFFKKRNYAAMAMLVFAVAIGNELNKWIKEAVGRPRPDLEQMVKVESFSFPSGHAMIGMILYMILAYLIIQELSSKGPKWMIGILAGLLIFLMGISRVMMQVHYPSDVAAGFALGFLWAFLWIILYESLKGKLGKRQHEKRLS